MEKREILTETIVAHARSFALAAIDRLPSNMKSAIYIKFPKDIIRSEEYESFDMMAFGYMYKSLCDLTTEVTMEQRADKLREDVSAVVKKTTTSRRSEAFISSLSCTS